MTSSNLHLFAQGIIISLIVLQQQSMKIAVIFDPCINIKQRITEVYSTTTESTDFKIR